MATGAGTAPGRTERDSETARSSDDGGQPIPRSARAGSDQSGVVSVLLVHAARYFRFVGDDPSHRGGVHSSGNRRPPARSCCSLAATFCWRRFFIPAGVTLLFAVWEYLEFKFRYSERWKPESLPPVPPPIRQPQAAAAHGSDHRRGRVAHLLGYGVVLTLVSSGSGAEGAFSARQRPFTRCVRPCGCWPCSGFLSRGLAIRASPRPSGGGSCAPRVIVAGLVLAIFLLRTGDLLVAGPNWNPTQAKSLATLNQMVAGVLVLACIFSGLVCVHELRRFVASLGQGPSNGRFRLLAKRRMTSSHSLAALEGVHKRYGDQVALDGLDLEVHEGELLALLGPNGAGKTTAISILLGLKRPDAGSVRLLGGSPRDIANRRGVGVMLQQEQPMADMTLRELLDVVTSYYPNPYTPAEAIELTRTGDIAGKQYMRLSGGQQRRVQYALAICGRPALVFLDEPTAGLDVESREMQWETIRALLGRGTAIVLTTHYLEEAEELADRVVMLAERQGHRAWHRRRDVRTRSSKDAVLPHQHRYRAHRVMA